MDEPTGRQRWRVALCRLVVLAAVGAACGSTTVDPVGPEAGQALDPAPATTAAERDDETPSPDDTSTAARDTGGEPDESDAEPSLTPVYPTDATVLEGLVALPADVLGTSRPDDQDPSSGPIGTYTSLCPRRPVEASTFTQNDPLFGGVPVTRYFLLFPSATAAREFFDGEAALDVGCVDVNETTTSTATTTIERVETTTVGGAEALEVEAAVSVKLEGTDGAGPSAAVVRLHAIEENVVVIAVALQSDEDQLGSDLFEPLVIDGLDTIRTTATS